MSMLDEFTSVCQSTGLAIVESRGQSIFRVAKESRGPLNPPERSGTDVRTWSRWDTPGRTVYGGSDEKCAFMEVLPYVSPAPPAVGLTSIFDDVNESDAATLVDQIAKEVPAHGGMPFGSLPKGWRDDRRLYELVLPSEGWFIAITADESITAVNAACRPVLEKWGVERLTLSELTRSDAMGKSVTTGIATWIRDRITLFDGSRPHGITYPSKWGMSLVNWSVWLRRTDDGVGPDPIGLRAVSDIGRHTPGFIEAAASNGLIVR